MHEHTRCTVLPRAQSHIPRRDRHVRLLRTNSPLSIGEVGQKIRLGCVRVFRRYTIGSFATVCLEVSSVAS